MFLGTEIYIFTGIACKLNENKGNPKIVCAYAPNGKDAFKDIQNVWKIKVTSDDMKGLQSTRTVYGEIWKGEVDKKKRNELISGILFVLFHTAI